MSNNLGYNQPIYILAFDHRSSFIKKMFDFEPPYTEEQKAKVADFKFLIYEGFKKGVELGIPKEEAALLVEEEFGDAVLRDAKSNGFAFILTSEKSGQEEFDFEYGEDFPAHIEKYQPNFTKALVRYNPEGDSELNARQAAKLKVLSDYSRDHGYKFLAEPVIPATQEQLDSVDGDKKRYDEELRPRLAVKMIEELQQAGAEPDIWKIEGMSKQEDYQAVVKQARRDGRENVAVVVLGRGESAPAVENWLLAGTKVSGVIGFAIGRTIFWEALEKFRDEKVSRQEAVEEIGKNYHHFYQVFANN